MPLWTYDKKDNFFTAVGVFNAAGIGQKDKEESCLEHNPFFDWYTCTCSFEKCLEMQQKKQQQNNGANKRAVSGVMLMASVLTTWAVKQLICI